MKENVIDVLMYLFEHYIDEDASDEPDRDYLEGRLIAAGFGNREVSQAFDWLEELADLEDCAPIPATEGSIRVYTAAERERLGTDGISLLHSLQQLGVMNASVREQILERVMALGLDTVDGDQLRWVVLMVMLNQAGEDPTDLAWLEDLVYDGRPRWPH
ncbi:MAG: DUF494 family protein [Thiotrichales bacterium]